MSDFDDPNGDEYGERLRRVLDAQARAMDPTEPMDDGLVRIRERTAQAPSVMHRWAVPMAAAAAAVLVVVGGAVLWPHLGGSPTGVGSAGPSSGSPQPTLPSEGPSPSQTPSASGGPVGSGISVPVYFGVTFNGQTMLYREFHHVVALDPARAAVQQMLAGPEDSDYKTLWPHGTTLTGLTRSGDLATVTLTAAPKTTTPAGSAVQEVVYTVTAADPTIRRVTVAYPGGSATNVTRAITYAALAQVWLLSPTDGATVSSRLSFSGVAEVFEAHVNWEVDKLDGTVVAQGFAMAKQAAPGRWPWSASVTLPPGTYVLRAFAISPKDGSVVWPDSKTITVR